MEQLPRTQYSQEFREQSVKFFKKVDYHWLKQRNDCLYPRVH